jgi:hypothetical protein
MPELDDTFSDKDVIRIYEKHLTTEERRVIDRYFNGQPHDVSPREKAAAEFIATNGADLQVTGLILAANLADWIVSIEDIAGQELIEWTRSFNRELTETIEEMDRKIREAKALTSDIPILRDVVDAITAPVREIRDLLRNLRAIANVPNNLVMIRRDLESYKDAFRESEEHIIYLQNILEDIADA